VSQKHLLVLGAGSVGKRHAANFSRLGCLVSAMDPRQDRLAEANDRVPLEETFLTLESALSQPAMFSGVVVCSPPKFHVQQAVAAVKNKLPVFLEKPVGPDLKSAVRLAKIVSQTQIPLLLGYTYRWWPPLMELKSRLEQNAIGKVLHVRCTMSAHLEDWHPWERYQDFFMASEDLGGGALLDESHFIDLMLWFFGKPNEVFAKVERLSSLEIEADDNVDAWLSYSEGLRVSIHLDLYGRPHEKTIVVKGEQGTFYWSFDPNCLRFSQSAQKEWSDTRYSFERNDMFLNAAREFVRVIDTREPPTCSIDDGCEVLRVIEAMRKSSISGEVVRLK